MRELAAKDFIAHAKAAEAKAISLYGADAETRGKGVTKSATRVYPITPVNYAVAVAADWFAISKGLAKAIAEKDSIFDFFNDPGDCAEAIEDAKNLEEVVRAFAKGNDCQGLEGTEWQFVDQAGLGIVSMSWGITPIAGNRRRGGSHGELLSPTAAIMFWDGIGKIALALQSQQFPKITVAEKWRAFTEGAIEGAENVIATAGSVVAGATSFAGEAILAPLLKTIWIPLAALVVVYVKFKPF